MRTTITALAIVAFAGTGLHAEQEEPRVLAHLELECTQKVIRLGELLDCRVLLELSEDAGIAFVPRTVTPFPIPPRPPAVLRLIGIKDGKEQALPLHVAATRGRYDLGALEPSEIQRMSGGQIIGWRIRVNGEGWLLPQATGKVRIAAELEVSYPNGEPLASLLPSTLSAIRPCLTSVELETLKHRFLSGKWQSPPVEIEVVP